MFERGTNVLRNRRVGMITCKAGKVISGEFGDQNVLLHMHECRKKADQWQTPPPRPPSALLRLHMDSNVRVLLCVVSVSWAAGANLKILCRLNFDYRETAIIKIPLRPENDNVVTRWS